jgi:glycosyltransferase involved in cell wall biosynthesis
MTAPEADTSGLRLLVVSRVVAARDTEGIRFQALDGHYIDGVARAFGATRVAAQMVVEGEHEAYDNFAAYAYHFAAPDLHVVPLPVARGASPGMVATAWKQVRQGLQLRGEVEWCDLAFVFLPAYAGSLAALWCRLKRRPYACYVGGDWVAYSPLAFRWRGLRSLLVRPYTWVNGWLEARAVQGAAIAIVSGETILERYRAAGVRAERTVPLAAFAAGDVFEREDTCGGPGVTLLFVGALLPGKGLQHLLAALPLVPDARLEVVGAGRDAFAEELRAIARGAGVEDRVRWHGYVAEPARLREIYRGADVFVLPTLSEGAPRVVWEAMSQGLPVVVSDIPPVRAALTPDVDAVFAPPADPSGIAGSVQRLRHDRHLRRALIRRGYERAAEKLGRDPATQAVELLRQYVVPLAREQA